MENVDDSKFMDQEHQVQINLIDALGEAVADGSGNPAELFDQLASYTSIHFMSEQLLMRQYSYLGQDAHEAEHDSMMEYLSTARELMANNDLISTAESLIDLRTKLLKHIATQDHLLSAHIASAKAGSNS